MAVAARSVFMFTPLLSQSEQEKALQHYRAISDAARSEAIARGQSAKLLKQVVVIGDNSAAVKIVRMLDRAGIKVVTLVSDDAAADRMADYLNRKPNSQHAPKLPSTCDDQQCSRGFLVSTDLNLAAKADLAIIVGNGIEEPIDEWIEPLERVLPDNSIVAVVNLGIELDEITAKFGAPHRLIGLNFVGNLNDFELLEISGNTQTSEDALATGYALAVQLQLFVGRCGAGCGGTLIPVLAHYHEVADGLLLDGSNPWEIDEAMVDFGFVAGPYEAQDVYGIDLAYENRKQLSVVGEVERRQNPITPRMINEGRLGRKSGVGWYRYPGGHGPVIDPLLEDMMREEAYFANVPRREISADEIRKILLLALINSATNLMAEGKGKGKAADALDLLSVVGLGFPRKRGGLIYFADQIGVKTIVEQIHQLAKTDPVIWQPSQLLLDCARSGTKLSQYHPTS